MSKSKATQQFADPSAGPIFSVRFLIALALMVLGIAWIVFYYLQLRTDLVTTEPGGPAFLADLERWNYVIGFGLLFLGLAISAHPSTPLGRGRGVVVGMLACFLLGLLWICVYYVFSNDLSGLAVFNDLNQYNLVVGIGFMAVGFTFATRWE